MKRTVLITGANGFVGRNMAELLSKTYTIVGADRKKLNLLNTQAVFDYIKQGRFDVVLHCATYNDTRNSTNNISKTLSVNLRMFFNLARCQQYFGRMFYFGTGAELDQDHYVPKMSETYFDSYVPSNDGAFSKYVMTKFSERSDKIYEMRLFGCYGKYEDWQIRFISNACCKALHDMNITIRQNTFLDYLYIEDLAKILTLFINKRHIQYKNYNICTGKPIDLKSLANIVRDISGKNVEIKIARRGLKPEYSGNNLRLIGEIGNFRFTPHADAIRQLYLWYSKNKNNISKKLLYHDK